MGGLGAGDVKLFGVISTLVESRCMIRLIIISIIIGAAYGLFRLVKNGQLIKGCRCLLYQGIGGLFHKQKFAIFQQMKTGEGIHFTVCILMGCIWCICKEGVL